MIFYWIFILGLLGGGDYLLMLIAFAFTNQMLKTVLSIQYSHLLVCVRL